MRSFVILYRLRDDLGTDLARLLLPAGYGNILHDHRIYIVLLQIINKNEDKKRAPVYRYDSRCLHFFVILVLED